MESRLELQQMLEKVLGTDGNVYFQPPENVELGYPAIIYERSGMQNDFADNRIYSKHVKYQVILLDYDPDSQYIDRLLELPFCSYDRHYYANNVNHDVFTIYH